MRHNITDLTEAETGQRGFLLTGDGRYLTPLADLPVLLKSLATLSLDHSDQIKRVESLRFPGQRKT